MRIWECPEASFIAPFAISGKREVDEKCVGETGTLDVVVKGSGGGLKVKWQATDEFGNVVEDGWLEGIGDEEAAGVRGDESDDSNVSSTPSPFETAEGEITDVF